MLGAFCFERSLVLYSILAFTIQLIYTSFEPEVWNLELVGVTAWTWTLCHSTLHCDLVQYLNALYTVYTHNDLPFVGIIIYIQVSKLWGRTVYVCWNLTFFVTTSYMGLKCVVICYNYRNSSSTVFDFEYGSWTLCVHDFLFFFKKKALLFGVIFNKSQIKNVQYVYIPWFETSRWGKKKTISADSLQAIVSFEWFFHEDYFTLYRGIMGSQVAVCRVSYTIICKYWRESKPYYLFYSLLIFFLCC